MNRQNNAGLSAYTSLKTGGPAENLIVLDEEDDLQKVIAENNDKPVWILGYGTNCLISDKGLPGTVILNRHGKIEELSQTSFKVDSGVDWDEFIQKLITKNLWGLEFTSGIPGGVGAAVAGNIAAYGHKVADSFVEATILNSETGEIKTWDKKNLKFEYRSSALQQADNSHRIVIDATFELKKSPTGVLEYESALKVARELGIKPDTLANRRKIILETRSRAGSLLKDRNSGPWTAGSFFKNPVVNEDQIQNIINFEESDVSRDQLIRQQVIHGEDKMRVSAAHVLLAAGFKRSQSWGNVRLHPDHILKLENAGQATAQEMYNVVQEILETVEKRLGIKLEPEVRFLGEFK